MTVAVAEKPPPRRTLTAVATAVRVPQAGGDPVYVVVADGIQGEAVARGWRSFYPRRDVAVVRVRIIEIGEVT